MECILVLMLVSITDKSSRSALALFQEGHGLCEEGVGISGGLNLGLRIGHQSVLVGKHTPLKEALELEGQINTLL